jgi:hypothetical protein
MVLIDLMMEKQKPLSNENGFCCPSKNGWELLAFPQIIAKCVVDASKSQFVWSHLEAFRVQALAIDPNRCFVDLCLAISMEVLFQLPGSIFYTGSKVSITERFTFNPSPPTPATHCVDGVELYKHRAIPDFDMEVSSIG